MSSQGYELGSVISPGCMGSQVVLPDQMGLLAGLCVCCSWMGPPAVLCDQVRPQGVPQSWAGSLSGHPRQVGPQAMLVIGWDHWLGSLAGWYHRLSFEAALGHCSGFLVRQGQTLYLTVRQG